MRYKAWIVLIALVMSLSATACDKSNTVDMKKFKETMQKESKTSVEKKKEIRKSIFPNWKEKDD